LLLIFVNIILYRCNDIDLTATTLSFCLDNKNTIGMKKVQEETGIKS